MKGICFIEPLFHKVVKGEKTQTRRIIKSSTGFFNVESKDGVITSIWKCDADGSNGDNLIPVMPKYKVGEKVYLKEPYYIHTDGDLHYKFDGKEDVERFLFDETKFENIKWLNKLFMPAWAARYFIEITAVRAERLQDISEEDCLKEGIEKEVYNGRLFNSTKYCNGSETFSTPKEAYAELIDKINGKDTWERNPFVWIYDFKLLNKKL